MWPPFCQPRPLDSRSLRGPQTLLVPRYGLVPWISHLIRHRLGFHVLLRLFMGVIYIPSLGPIQQVIGSRKDPRILQHFGQCSSNVSWPGQNKIQRIPRNKTGTKPTGAHYLNIVFLYRDPPVFPRSHGRSCPPGFQISSRLGKDTRKYLFGTLSSPMLSVKKRGFKT